MTKSYTVHWLHLQLMLINFNFDFIWIEYKFWTNSINHFALYPSFRIFFKHYISCSKMCTQVVEMQENICQKNDMTFFLMPSILRNFKIHQGTLLFYTSFCSEKKVVVYIHRGFMFSTSELELQTSLRCQVGCWKQQTNFDRALILFGKI